MEGEEGDGGGGVRWRGRREMEKGDVEYDVTKMDPHLFLTIVGHHSISINDLDMGTGPIEGTLELQYHWPHPQDNSFNLCTSMLVAQDPPPS